MLGLREISAGVVDVISSALVTRSSYFEFYARASQNDVSSYNELHMAGNGIEQNVEVGWFEEARMTGELFPGRNQVRPNLDFGNTSSSENSRSCHKIYITSKSYTPGIFTVQCVSRHPKLIGVSVMMKPEGTSTALSILLSRFRHLPRVCYYDNGCNMARSIVLRVPWVNNICRLLCDRFHYSGHTCNSICDPDSYLSSSNHATSGAESINQLWTFSKSHLRFLRPENLMPFLTARSIFLNVRSRVRENTGKTDINTKMILDYVHKQWKCSCARFMSLN